ncbi:SGNH/GDSL hydrolase family protein [Paraburkholderia hayleyella]|uniref:SGNH/GDSL hydrolase family protein n=1 Tax=Paraburkholderia hayleyella TaxID=2152889 RepID=UPI00129298F2|nr:SGNH/GDSL hydrolase family protein [Paraburkholderia hayleyella]
MTIRFLAVVCGFVFLEALSVSPLALAADAPVHWVSAWGTALQPIPQRADLPSLYRAPKVAGRTMRQIIYPMLSGKSARLHISNAYATTPLVIQALSIAPSQGGAAVQQAKEAHVTFAGQTSVVVPPGRALDSDPISIEIDSGAPYAISSYMGSEQRLSAWHRVSSQINYVSLPGNYVSHAAAAPFATRFTQYAWISGLSVAAPASSTSFVAIGDSITDGMRSSLNQNRRWPDALARRLARDGNRSIGVVNLGISGNRLLSDSPCYGDALERRFGPDVLGRPAVKTVILLIGINDINFADMPPHTGLDCDFPHTRVTAASLIEGYRRIIATARRHGIRLIGATLTPASLPPAREGIRTAVNQWIRSSREFDGVIDFDLALRDAAEPGRLRRAYDSGDHIHPGDAGYEAMAQAIDLKEIAAPIAHNVGG